MSEPNSDVMEESGDSVEVDTQDQSDTKEEFTLENLPLVDDDVDSDTETTDDPSQADNPRLSTSESMDVTTAEPFADSSENKTPAKAKGASKKKVAGSTAKVRRCFYFAGRTPILKQASTRSITLQYNYFGTPALQKLFFSLIGGVSLAFFVSSL
jgi:hypothetical protein